jgi:hypothetical protein
LVLLLLLLQQEGGVQVTRGGVMLTYDDVY